MDCDFEDCREAPVWTLTFAGEDSLESEDDEDGEDYAYETAAACALHGKQTRENGGALAMGMGPFDGVTDWMWLVDSQPYDGLEVVSDPPIVYRTQPRPH